MGDTKQHGNTAGSDIIGVQSITKSVVTHNTIHNSDPGETAKILKMVLDNQARVHADALKKVLEGFGKWMKTSKSSTERKKILNKKRELEKKWIANAKKKAEADRKKAEADRKQAEIEAQKLEDEKKHIAEEKLKLVEAKTRAEELANNRILALEKKLAQISHIALPNKSRAKTEKSDKKKEPTGSKADKCEMMPHLTPGWRLFFISAWFVSLFHLYSNSGLM
jgi:riboflavin synthase